MGDATRRRALLAVVVLTLVVLAGIGFLRGRDHESSDGAASPEHHRVQVARHGVGAATVEVVGGTDSLTVADADLGDDLADVQTRDGSRAVPSVQTTGSTLTVGTRDSRQADRGGPVLLTVRLNRAVAWTIRSSGGTAHLQIRLQGADLRALSVDAGVTALDLTVGRPRGATDVHVSGGASTVRVQLPAGTPTRYTFSGGAGSASVGSQRHGGLAGGSVIASPGFASAVDRVDVHLDSGVGTLLANT